MMLRKVFVVLAAAALVAGLAGGLAAALGAADAPTASSAIQLALVSRFDVDAAEISAYDPASRRLFVTGAGLQVIDISDPADPAVVAALPVEATSVAVRSGVVAAAVPANPAQDPGKVLIMDTDGVVQEELTVGALPDMLTFTPDGARIVVANEGEPDGGDDPQGSISIITLGSPSTVQSVDFSAFDAQRAALVDAGVRIFPTAGSLSQDVEPEYVACSPDGATAMVTLQEANSVALVDIATATVTAIVPLGLKDWSTGPMLDPSDKDGGIAMANWPVFGMYMPDGIASFASGGQTYYVTANEGDARSEDERVKDLDLDPAAFPNAADLQKDAALGRLNASSIDGDVDADGDMDRLQIYGARSFSVWDESGSLVYDSGDTLEAVVADLFPDMFNANDGLASEVDKRSDDKGPEAEGVTIGEAYGTTYAFVGMERAAGGVMAFDMTDPAAPVFAAFARSDADVAPEGITFINAEDSPNGVPLVVLTHEVSSTVAIYGVIQPGSESAAVTGVPKVRPLLETRPVLDDVDAEDGPRGARLGDADDPAIWVHPKKGACSIAVCALKDGGIDVYDLDGQLLQEIAPDDVRYNNVDVTYGFRMGCGRKAPRADLAVATDRRNDVLAVFRIDPVTRKLTDITDPAAPLIFTPAGQESDKTTTAYGIALWRTRCGATYAFVNRRKTGDVAQLRLVANPDGTVGWRTVRSFSLPVPEGGELEDAQTEGMVVDERSGWLYIGQEGVGIWKVRAAACSHMQPRLIHSVESDYLEADVEGLTIYYGRGMSGYLFASSQGDNTFAVFSRRRGNRYLGSFQIVSRGCVDGSQECDGAQVMSLPLGPRYPFGLLIVQDGYNDPQFMVHDDGEFENSSANFKFVPWQRVAKAAGLIIDTRGHDPRK